MRLACCICGMSSDLFDLRGEISMGYINGTGNVTGIYTTTQCSGCSMPVKTAYEILMQDDMYPITEELSKALLETFGNKVSEAEFVKYIIKEKGELRSACKV